MRRSALLLAFALAGAGCATPPQSGQGPRAPDPDPGSGNAPQASPAAASNRLDPATLLPPEPTRADAVDARRNPDAPLIALTGGTVLTAAGERYEPGLVVLEGGSIRYVGSADGAEVPDGAQVIDATGRFITPGIIDSHSHLGVYASPGVSAHADGNEVGAPVTAGVRAEYGFWPHDPGIPRAVAGGVTAALVLPGSANLVGGRGFTVVLRTARSADEVRFPGAPDTVKMACGENPKRVYGEKGGPSTRMGEYTVFRDRFRQAAEYNMRWEVWRHRHRAWQQRPARSGSARAGGGPDGAGSGRGGGNVAPEPPPRDHLLDTLAAVLRGEALVQIHCYRGDDIRQMIDIADTFGFRIRSFHHALEAYKVRDLLVARDIAINTWADWWGFKMEAFDGIPENAALFAESGGRSVIHSDSPIGVQRLNQEAGKAMWAGRHAGIEISEDQALRWITANPAWVLGIDDVTGTLETGKRADVVLWSAHPLSVYAQADVVIQGGELVYDRAQGRPLTDFELGAAAPTGASNP
ncbi:amidohydrolase family protein [Haliangium sp.]|uniref:amidohydrolase n=1 Tax=Haliangium sp. TaxID=2663208 RepID=UPI003D0FC018